MTRYLSDKICVEAERRIATFCEEHNLDFNCATAYKYVLKACENKPIFKTFYNKATDEFRSCNITEDVAWEYCRDKMALERVREKVKLLKENKDKKKFADAIEVDLRQAKPDLDKLVDALYQFNIMDGQSYLALVYFLMQLKYTRGGKEMGENRTDQKIALFLNGIQRSGKSSLVKALIKLEKDYGTINFVNDADAFESRFEENLWKAHLNFCDEVVPSKIKLGVLVKAIDGGMRQLEHKNQTPYNYNVNSNFIFASNDDISLKQRRVSVVKFGKKLQEIIPFETLYSWVKMVMDSLPNFYWHPQMYNLISEENLIRLNPLGLSDVTNFLGDKLLHLPPESNKIIKFNISQIFQSVQKRTGQDFLKNTRKEGIQGVLKVLLEDRYICEFKYPGTTTTQYKISVDQYYNLKEWSDSINTPREVLTKISKQGLRALLKPYFEPIPSGDNPGNGGAGNNTQSVIYLPPPTELLALPAPLASGKMETFPATNLIKELSIDLETYSDVDIKHGVYKHASSPNFDILLFSYAVNGGEVKTVDLASGEKLPEEILKALTDDTVIKWAFNANFERVCLSFWLRKNYPQYFKGYDTDEVGLKNYLDPTSWRCSKVWSNYMGVHNKMERVCKVLCLSKQKMEGGKNLIKYFCHPCKPSKANGWGTRNLPQHNPQKWETFKQYNKRDVEAELEIKEHLKLTPVPDYLWGEYALDQKINDRGVKVDIDFIQHALELIEANRAVCLSEMRQLTGLKNPNSTTQLKVWLKQQGIDLDNTEKRGDESGGKKNDGSIDKRKIEELLNQPSTPESVVQVLKLRQQLSKSSVGKYKKMYEMVCPDGRVHGCLMFYGALTGRWVGRGVQLQNLPQNHIKDLDMARDAVKNAKQEMLKQAFVTTQKVNGVETDVPLTIPDALSQLTRTAFIPENVGKFIVSDYSQIEARVLSLLAGEQWRLDAFNAGKDIYCESASQMFNKPVIKNGLNGDLRVKGKIAELALGYGGGTNALIRMDSDKTLDEKELPDIVDRWREANPKIVEFWAQCDKAAKKAIQERTHTQVGDIGFWCPEDILYIDLPSGRSLVYRNPEIQSDENGYQNIVYQSYCGREAKAIKTYGAKLVENIVQAVSRDILAYALQNLANYPVVIHVHDEVIAEVPQDIPVNAITDIMEQTPPWIEGLPLKAEGYECQYYQKQ